MHLLNNIKKLYIFANIKQLHLGSQYVFRGIYISFKVRVMIPKLVCVNSYRTKISILISQTFVNFKTIEPLVHPNGSTSLFKE